MSNGRDDVIVFAEIFFYRPYLVGDSTTTKGLLTVIVSIISKLDFSVLRG